MFGYPAWLRPIFVIALGLTLWTACGGDDPPGEGGRDDNPNPGNLTVVQCRKLSNPQIIAPSTVAAVKNAYTNGDNLVMYYRDTDNGAPSGVEQTVLPQAQLGLKQGLMNGFSQLLDTDIARLSTGSRFAGHIAKYSSANAYVYWQTSSAVEGGAWLGTYPSSLATPNSEAITLAPLADDLVLAAWTTRVTTPTVQPRKLYYAIINSKGQEQVAPAQLVDVQNLRNVSTVKNDDRGILLYSTDVDAGQGTMLIWLRTLNEQKNGFYAPVQVTPAPRQLQGAPVAMRTQTGTFVAWTEIDGGSESQVHVVVIKDDGTLLTERLIQNANPTSMPTLGNYLGFVALVYMASDAGNAHAWVELRMPDGESFGANTATDITAVGQNTGAVRVTANTQGLMGVAYSGSVEGMRLVLLTCVQ